MDNNTYYEEVRGPGLNDNSDDERERGNIENNFTLRPYSENLRPQCTTQLTPRFD
jgi:hypothetical protein